MNIPETFDGPWCSNTGAIGGVCHPAKGTDSDAKPSPTHRQAAERHEGRAVPPCSRRDPGVRPEGPGGGEHQ